ncbi:calmodulin-binding protein-like protein [Corchorus capsularis]|uniref:Calmodulin-binding protein-like protein n=1 Tax=Corchorus capsularis TaxID=210143 RepID=A0A1R3J3E3_COCAP|nr:calmodulin-binding protein-like protein [Corchorus capsularis]
MGAAVSCPLSDIDDLEGRLEAVIVKPISFKDDDEVKKPVKERSALVARRYLHPHSL